MKESSVLLTVLFCYFGLMLAIAVWARRANTSGAGYFLAGRKLPYWVAAFSMNATGESAWLLLGLSGVAYLTGLHALWIVAGETIGVLLAWLLVAKKLNHESRKLEAITVPDYLSTKHRGSPTAIRTVSVAVILSMAVIYIAAQMLATGKAFTVFLDWDYATGVWVGGLVTIVYTSLGGFKAVAYTDAIQAMLMLFALTVVPWAGLQAIGGVDVMWESLRTIDASMLSLWQPEDPLFVTIVVITGALAVGLPFIGVPQLLVRFMAIKEAQDIKKAATVSVIVILLFDLGAVATGLVGRVLFPEMADAERIMPVLAEELFPPIITGILVVAVLSAVMSTVSSLLNLASSAIVNDIYAKSRRSSNAAREASLGRWTTLLLGVFGCAIAMSQDGVIFSLVLFAWSGLGAAFGPVILCSLRWRKTTRQGILAGMLSGFAVNVLWVLIAKEKFYGLYEMVPAFIAGLCVTIVVSQLTYTPAGDSGNLESAVINSDKSRASKSRSNS